jgi:hypothetical protein
MVHIGEYTIIVPEEYEQSLLDAETAGKLQSVENATDEFDIAKTVEQAIRIPAYFVIVVRARGRNGHK